jgi:glucan 1,3-beta-glucosidase
MATVSRMPSRVLKSQGNIYLYGTNVKSVTNLIVSTNTDIATESANAGGWGGVIAAYAYDA